MELSVNDLCPVLEAVHPARTKWINLGLQLHVPVDRLDSIERERGDDGDHLRQMLKYWLKSGTPTWGALSHALKSPTVGEGQLAKKLDVRAARSQSLQLQSKAMESTSTLSLSYKDPGTTAASATPSDQSRGSPASAIECSKWPSSTTVQLSTGTSTMVQPPTVNSLDRNIEEEIQELEDHFFDVALKAAVNLEKVDLSKIKMCITLLPVSMKYQHINLLQEHHSAISDAKSVHKIFSILAQYWDFLNCGLLSEIIRQFGDHEMKQLMKEYLTKLMNFRKHTKLGEFVDKWIGNDHHDYEEFATKMGENWRERTLEDLEKFRIQWSRRHSFMDYATVVKTVTTGCVTVVWGLHRSISLTASLFEDVLPLLQESNIRRVMSKGKCILELSPSEPSLPLSSPDSLGLSLVRSEQPPEEQIFDTIDGLLKVVVPPKDDDITAPDPKKRKLDVQPAGSGHSGVATEPDTSVEHLLESTLPPSPPDSPEPSLVKREQPPEEQKFDFINTLLSYGVPHIVQEILSYVGAHCLCIAERVCVLWYDLITSLPVWRRAIKRKVNSDRVWKGLSEKRGWEKYLQQGGSPEGATADFYHQLYKDIARDVQALYSNWKRGKYTVNRIECGSAVYCLQYDSEKIVSGHADGTVKMWDISTLQCVKILEGHKGVVQTLQYNNEVLITGSYDNTVKVWAAHTGEELNKLVHHQDEVRTLKFQDNTLVTGSGVSGA